MAILNNHSKLESSLRERSLKRVKEQTAEKAMSEDEIAQLSKLSSRLIPESVVLKEGDSAELRALANFSRISLKPANQIVSHRKFIGPVIVFCKKLTWPIVAFHLKGTFEALEEFASLSVTKQIKLQARVAELESGVEKSGIK